MTTLYAQRPKTASTDELKQRAGQPATTRQQRWYADHERRCEESRRRRERLALLYWVLGCVVALGAVALELIFLWPETS